MQPGIYSFLLLTVPITTPLVFLNIALTTKVSDSKDGITPKAIDFDIPFRNATGITCPKKCAIPRGGAIVPGDFLRWNLF